MILVLFAIILTRSTVSGEITCAAVENALKQVNDGHSQEILKLLQCAQGDKVECNVPYSVEDCKVYPITLENLRTVEDFDNCAPSLLPKIPRNYYLAGAGRRITYKENYNAFKKLSILQEMMRDVSQADLTTNILGKDIAFPVGISPVGIQKLAHPDGELATARAVNALGTIMILSIASTISLEEISSAAPTAELWMQTFIFRNRDETRETIRRAEKAGFSAIVVTVDSPIIPQLTCDVRNALLDLGDFRFPNMFNGSLHQSKHDPSVTWNDLKWVVGLTSLPIIAKGILTGPDAIKAAEAGASAIIVSNHGGRQMDSGPATIDVLPEVVTALQYTYPYVEVYMDGGIRNGYDMYKAFARGARFVFVGRPAVWGLAVKGEEGVRKMLTILRYEFNETMILAGASRPSEISIDTVRSKNCDTYFIA